MSVKRVEVVVRKLNNALPFSLQSCDSWIVVKENQDRKKKKKKKLCIWHKNWRKGRKLSWRKLHKGQITSSHVHLMLCFYSQFKRYFPLNFFFGESESINLKIIGSQPGPLLQNTHQQRFTGRYREIQLS